MRSIGQTIGQSSFELHREKTCLWGFRQGLTRSDTNQTVQLQNMANKASLMEIKCFSQCIAANKQQACSLAAAASCSMVAACEFFVCKLVLLLLVAATLRL